MFVIIQCRNTLSQADKSKDVVERLGVTLRHAGVAITITSITNFIAFGIGATTAMPALKSFCVYASIGILSIFFFQVMTMIIVYWRLYWRLYWMLDKMTVLVEHLVHCTASCRRVPERGWPGWLPVLSPPHQPSPSDQYRPVHPAQHLVTRLSSAGPAAGQDPSQGVRSAGDPLLSSRGDIRHSPPQHGVQARVANGSQH